MSSSTGARSKVNANSEMTKANDISLSPPNTTITSNSPDTSVNVNANVKNEKKKKVFIYFYLFIIIINLFHALDFSCV